MIIEKGLLKASQEQTKIFFILTSFNDLKR